MIAYVVKKAFNGPDGEVKRGSIVRDPKWKNLQQLVGLGYLQAHDEQPTAKAVDSAPARKVGR